VQKFLKIPITKSIKVFEYLSILHSYLQQTHL